MTPNALAWIALYAWPAVVLVVYASRGSRSLARTTAWMMILPVMFLPAVIELPFAALNKHRIAFLSIAGALALFHGRELGLRDRARHLPLVLLVAFGLTSLMTVRTNSDPLSFGILRLPGLGIRDAAWITYAFFVDLFLPFAIGQRVFRTERDLRDLLEVLSTCALLYVPLCLVEMRLSPQMSNWVYGYFPHSFAQTARGSGYRPFVFMNHGLSVGMFLFSGFCASLALRGMRTRFSLAPGPRAAVIGAVLLLARNLGSTLFAGIALVLQTFKLAKLRSMLLLAIVAVVVTYPTLRAAGVFPVDEIGNAFRAISTERSASLLFRFEQEDRLLDRAVQRPIFGWGNWGRSRIYVHWGEPGDWWAGWKDVSVTDGLWIIWLGTTGVVGFGLTMALLVFPVVRYVRGAARMQGASRRLAGGLALIVGLYLLDMLPNAQSDLLHVAYAGALFTLSARLRAASDPVGVRSAVGLSGSVPAVPG